MKRVVLAALLMTFVYMPAAFAAGAFIFPSGSELAGESGSPGQTAVALEQLQQSTPAQPAGSGDTQMLEGLQQQESTAGPMERLAAGLVVALPNFAIKVLRLQDPVALIFQEKPVSENLSQDDAGSGPPSDPKNLYLWTYTQDEFKAVSVMYDNFQSFLPIVLVVVLIFLGVLLYLAAYNEKRMALKEYLLGAFIGLLALRLGVYFWQMAFDLNRSLVLMARAAIPVQGSFFDMLWRPETKSLGMAIVIFVAAASVGVLNWQYITRKLTLGVLIFIFPLVAAVSVIPQKRRVLDIWVREFLANIFLQAAHAIVYAFFIIWTQNANKGQDWFWYVLVFLMGINGIAGLIRNLIGAETVGGSAAGMAGAAVGVGSLVAMSKVGGLMFAGQKALTPNLGNAVPGGGSPGGGFSGGTGMPMGGGGLPGMGNGMTGAGAGMQGGLPGRGGAANTALRGGSMLATGGARALNLAAVGAGGLAGALISGVLTGHAEMGAAAGAAVGSTITDSGEKSLGALSRSMRGIVNESEATGQGVVETARERLGVFDKAQFLDPHGSAGIGRQAAGPVGGYVAGAVAQVARGYSRFRGNEGVTVADMYQQGRKTSFWEKDKALRDLQSATPRYLAAKEKLNQAKILYGEKTERYQEVLNSFNDVSAEVSGIKARAMQAESWLTHEGARKNFAQLRQAQSEDWLKGGVFDIEEGWRNANAE